MANPEHLAKLKEGVEAWNQWRKENPAINVDLNAEDLRGANLSSATLNGANLDGADLTAANLKGSKLLPAQVLRQEHINLFIGKSEVTAIEVGFCLRIGF